MDFSIDLNMCICEEKNGKIFNGKRFTFTCRKCRTKDLCRRSTITAKYEGKYRAKQKEKEAKLFSYESRSLEKRRSGKTGMNVTKRI